jgi:hypothetical protein
LSGGEELEMASALVAVWVTDYKLPQGNDKLRDD